MSSFPCKYVALFMEAKGNWECPTVSRFSLCLGAFDADGRANFEDWVTQAGKYVDKKGKEIPVSILDLGADIRRFVLGQFIPIDDVLNAVSYFGGLELQQTITPESRPRLVFVFAAAGEK